MKATTLEITFRKGKPFAAYLRLEGPRTKCHRAPEVVPSLLVDFDEAGRALGVEILSFDEATVARINDLLVSIGHAALPEQELAPLRAA
ncbi:MAG: hypothetical protein NVS3B20_12450 [Polyangiales bacterium]